MTNPHTATPWSYTVAATHLEYGATIHGPGSEEIGWPVVADIPPRTENGTHEGNAAFIVEAVNSHASLVEENRRLLAIEKAAQRLAYVVRKSVNAGPVSNDPTAEGQAWRALRLALGESYDEKGALT